MSRCNSHTDGKREIYIYRKRDFTLEKNKHVLLQILRLRCRQKKVIVSVGLASSSLPQSSSDQLAFPHAPSLPPASHISLSHSLSPPYPSLSLPLGVGAPEYHSNTHLKQRVYSLSLTGRHHSSNVAFHQGSSGEPHTQACRIQKSFRHAQPMANKNPISPAKTAVDPVYSCLECSGIDWDRLQVHQIHQDEDQ